MARLKEKIAYALGDAAAGGIVCLSLFLCFLQTSSDSRLRMQQY